MHRSRCFVALCPDEPARAQLDALGREREAACPGAQRMARANLHLTLAFIGTLEERRLPPIQELLAAMHTPHFAWRIDHLGSFGRARVVWAGGPADSRLNGLAQAVRDGLDDLRVSYDHKSFVAHVTLLRGVRDFVAIALPRAIAWQVSGPVLMVSERDTHGHVRYRPWGEADP